MDTPAPRPGPDIRPRLRRVAVAALSLWSLLLLLSAARNVHAYRTHSFEFARIDAEAAYERDVLYRRWATRHGGVYVPETAETPANPHLAHIPERDLVTPSGRRLTLVNPAYMTRQVYELGYASTRVTGRITSLNPLRPENAPDPWEHAALLALERGATEVVELSELSGETQLRRMRPFITEAGCLKCHGAQGYQVGDIRGGIAISVPFDHHRDLLHAELLQDLLFHAFIWIAGLAAIGFGARTIDRAAGERERHTRQIAAERERFLVTLQSIGDGVITTDLAGRVTLMNEVAERLTGWSGAEAAGRPLPEVFRILHEGSREPCVNPVEKVLEHGQVVGLANHTALVARDGTERSIADSGAPIRDPDGTVIGVVLVFRDVTEKNRIDEAMRNGQRLESLGLLAGGIAHDFNNLLGAIFGYMELARAAAGQGDTAQAARDLDDAASAYDRARALTGQLLTFAKGGEHRLRPLALAPLLESTARFALAGSSLVARFDLPADLPACLADESALVQVIDNLVVNARQATPSDGCVTLRAERVPAALAPSPLPRDRDYVAFSVADTGTGIPPAHLARVFDPFFTTKKLGSGLGLAVVHSVVTKFGGAVTIDSAPGSGTTVRVTLPAAASSAQDAPAPPGASSLAIPDDGRLLVLDDEEALRGVIIRMAARCGFAADPVGDGESAVRMYAEARAAGRPYTVVLLDLTLPGGPGGVEVLRRLRAIDPAVRAIAASGYAEDGTMNDPAAHGFAASLMKPFLLQDLAAALAAALPRDPGAPA